MRTNHLLISLALVFSQASHAATPEEITAANARAVVSLQIEDSSGGEIDHGTGFIVSHDGYVVTAAHLKVDPTQNQKMWAVIGERGGTTRFQLSLRDSDPNSDVALWRFHSPKRANTLSRSA